MLLVSEAVTPKRALCTLTRDGSGDQFIDNVKHCPKNDCEYEEQLEALDHTLQ